MTGRAETTRPARPKRAIGVVTLLTGGLLATFGPGAAATHENTVEVTLAPGRPRVLVTLTEHDDDAGRPGAESRTVPADPDATRPGPRRRGDTIADDVGGWIAAAGVLVAAAGALRGRRGAVRADVGTPGRG
jgi:hypothetical protein